MDTIITNATGYSSVEYSRLLEQAQAKGVSAAKVDEALIDAIQAGKDFYRGRQGRAEPAARTWRRPEKIRGPVRLGGPAQSRCHVRFRDPQRCGGAAAHQPQHHPGAGIADRRPDGTAGRQDRDGRHPEVRLRPDRGRGEHGGRWCQPGVAAAGVGRSSSGGLDMRAGNAADGQLTAAVAQSFNTMLSSAGSMFTAGGEFGQSMQSAEAKRLEAQQEQIRTMMEQTKQTNEALKDLVSKSLDFMSSMQANMNQTRTKILG